MEILLKDGTRIEGYTDGYVPGTPVSGEVVFTTSPVGYVEAITDPSYYGQILVFAFPEIGNYGVSPQWMESDRPRVKAVVASRITEPSSGPEGIESLKSFLVRHKVPYIEGVDTRALIVKIRKEGTLSGAVGAYPIKFEGDFFDPNDSFIHPDVSVKRPVEISSSKSGVSGPTVVLVDCGVKASIVKNLVNAGLRVLRVPCGYDFLKLRWDGLFLSNGPGNPLMCTPVLDRLPEAIKYGFPIAGVCLGQQLLAIAAGFKVYKLPYGHRGQNQPVLDLTTHRAFVTSQNHGWALSDREIPEDWSITHRNLNDGSVEGIRHRFLPFMTVQYHPEGRPGPLDSVSFFGQFADMVRNR